MGQDQGQVGTPVESGQREPEEIRRDIEATRQELGETAAALAAKTDVKARAKEKVAGVKETVTSHTGDGTGSSPVTQVTTTAKRNPIPTAAIAALVVGFLLGRITKRTG